MNAMVKHTQKIRFGNCGDFNSAQDGMEAVNSHPVTPAFARVTELGWIMECLFSRLDARGAAFQDFLEVVAGVAAFFTGNVFGGSCRHDFAAGVAAFGA